MEIRRIRWPISFFCPASHGHVTRNPRTLSAVARDSSQFQGFRCAIAEGWAMRELMPRAAATPRHRERCRGYPRSGDGTPSEFRGRNPWYSFAIGGMGGVPPVPQKVGGVSEPGRTPRSVGCGDRKRAVGFRRPRTRGNGTVDAEEHRGRAINATRRPAVDEVIRCGQVGAATACSRD